MSLDLLHTGPMLLISFAVAASALLVLLVGLRRGLVWTGPVVVFASVTDLLIAVVEEHLVTIRGVLWAAVGVLMFVTVPVLIGARALRRWKVGLSTRPALVYAGALFVGVGAGWILLPLAVGLLIGVFFAMRG